MLCIAAASIGVLLLLGVLGIVAGRQRWCLPAVYGGSAAAATMLCGVGVVAILAGATDTLALPVGLPWLAARFRIDAVSAFFLVTIDLAALAASLFAIGYGRHDDEPARVLPFHPWFLAAMNLVLLADDAFVFLFSWETMSLASWFLVMANHRRAETGRAAFLYLVMAGFGTGCLLLAFGLLAQGGSDYGFAALRATPLTPWAAGLVLAAGILGAGSKAGMAPLHVWLPLAHPAAPSHVSALMSAAMTKVAIYGLVRILLDLAGDFPWWAGAALLVLGALSAFVGILSALLQRDLKQLLAYSTVDNIGIILIGLGLAIAFAANGLAAAAALALTAALLHALNHAVMKTLLFCGAGAVLAATGSRDLDRLGGLIGRMPVTAAAVLIGMAAIAALPPLNGFVSEWLLFQAIVNSPSPPQWILKLMIPIAGAVLALAAALAAACFVKAYGVGFLGRPRSAAAAAATEPDRWMRGTLVGLAALCVVLGVAPVIGLQLAAPAVTQLLGSGLGAEASIGLLRLAPLAATEASYSGLGALLALALLTLATTLSLRRWASHGLRRAPPWDCGFPQNDPATQYGADGMAQPLRRVFGSTVFRAREHVDMPDPGDGRPARLTVSVSDPAWWAIFTPVQRLVEAASRRLDPMQSLTVRRHLSMMFGALVLLLFVMVVVS